MSNPSSEFLRQLKYDFLAALMEFVGTLLFLLLGLGGIQAAATAKAAHQTPDQKLVPTASMEQLLYISTSMGLALLATAWTFFRVSGSVFNPNVALALLLTGAMKPMRFCFYICAEILGAIAASGLLKATLPGKFSVNCSLHPQITPVQGVVIEAFLTATLTLTVLFMAVEKHRSTPFAPCAIGLILFATHLFGVIYTGAALNSARALGPDVVTQFSEHHWVYWVGPTLGAIVATLIYHFLKAIDLYALTPKQDSEDINDSPLAGIEISLRRPNSPSSASITLGKAPIDSLPTHVIAKQPSGGSCYPLQDTNYLVRSQSRRDRFNHEMSPHSSVFPEKGGEAFVATHATKG